MKTFKKLAGLCLVLSLCAGLCVFASCGDKGNDTSSVSEASESVSMEASAYEFTVLNADGTAATDVKVQLCAMDTGACYEPVAVDANGVCVYSPRSFPGAGVYEVHVLDADNKPLTLAEEVTTEAAFGEYTVTLAE